MSPSGDQFSDNVGSATTPPACISSCTSRGATYAGIVSWNVSITIPQTVTYFKCCISVAFCTWIILFGYLVVIWVHTAVPKVCYISTRFLFQLCIKSMCVRNRDREPIFVKIVDLNQF